MKVILVYDIELKDKKDQRRLNWAKKIARKYLNHVQKSVYEGEVTFSQLAKLKQEILEKIDSVRDSVIIYILPDGAKWEREILTEKEPPIGRLI